MKFKHLDIIERYFNGQMDSAEREGFEARLANDPALKGELEECRAIYEAIGDQEAMQLRRQLKDIARGFERGEGRNGTRNLKYEWYWLAALLIVSLSIAGIVYSMVNSPVISQYLSIRESVRVIDKGTYRLDPAFNDMMRYRFRSDDFILSAPRDSLVVEKDSGVVFRWSTTLQGPFFLDVLDRHGKQVYSTDGPIESPYVLKKSVPRGVYILRIRTADHSVCYRLLYVV